MYTYVRRHASPSIYPSIQPGRLLEICGAGPVSTSKVHSFVLVCVIACLSSFQLINLAKRNGFSHCVGPKKTSNMFICVIPCLSFYLFRLAARNGSSHCVEPKKKQATLRSRGTYYGSAGLDPSFFLLSSSTMIFCSPLPPLAKHMS